MKKAWVVTVDMGYGHERPAYAMRDIAYGDPIVANNYPGIPESDKKMWNESRSLYEFISRFKKVPLLGSAMFGAMDRVQRIEPFYPRRDLSKASLQVKGMYRLIHKGLGKDLVRRLSKRKMPLISTFFLTAFAAEEHGYPEDIYLVTTDADISRAWVAEDPKKSRIKYLASNGRVVERLKLYGVPSDRIFLTGFPMSKTLIGGTTSRSIKKDLGERVCHLDPNGIFYRKYHQTLKRELGVTNCQIKPTHPLTVTFAVGGAGAQKELGITIANSLREQIRRGEMILNLVAGTRKEVAKYFKDELKSAGLGRDIGSGVQIHYQPVRKDYFHKFDLLLRHTDILWTKPSELSFYAGIGLPIIMAPTVGSQEDFNRLWLQALGAGIDQFDPEFTNEWLFDWVNSGGLARMAWNGFIEAPTHGTYRIEELITGMDIDLPPHPMVV